MIRPEHAMPVSGAALSRHLKVQSVSRLADIVVLDAIIRISDASAIGFAEILHGRTPSGPASPLWPTVTSLSTSLKQHDWVS